MSKSSVCPRVRVHAVMVLVRWAGCACRRGWRWGTRRIRGRLDISETETARRRWRCRALGGVSCCRRGRAAGSASVQGYACGGESATSMCRPSPKLLVSAGADGATTRGGGVEEYMRLSALEDREVGVRLWKRLSQWRQCTTNPTPSPPSRGTFAPSARAPFETAGVLAHVLAGQRSSSSPSHGKTAGGGKQLDAQGADLEGLAATWVVRRGRDAVGGLGLGGEEEEEEGEKEKEAQEDEKDPPRVRIERLKRAVVLLHAVWREPSTPAPHAFALPEMIVCVVLCAQGAVWVGRMATPAPNASNGEGNEKGGEKSPEKAKGSSERRDRYKDRERDRDRASAVPTPSPTTTMAPAPQPAPAPDAAKGKTRTEAAHLAHVLALQTALLGVGVRSCDEWREVGVGVGVGGMHGGNANANGMGRRHGRRGGDVPPPNAPATLGSGSAGAGGVGAGVGVPTPKPELASKRWRWRGGCAIPPCPKWQFLRLLLRFGEYAPLFGGEWGLCTGVRNPSALLPGARFLLLHYRSGGQLLCLTHIYRALVPPILSRLTPLQLSLQRFQASMTRFFAPALRLPIASGNSLVASTA
ncbi:hypothetical protein DFH09DRAFT_1459068 [Mycena vulgaris]|nr:hypothetical protein DFH09DRAFT_1459068 [Mycena vulgaris]